MTENEGAQIEGTLHQIDGRGMVRMKGRYETHIDDLWLALTEPKRLARWYGKVNGDLNVGGEFTATVFASGWDGRGRIDTCLPPTRLDVTMWEEEGKEHAVVAKLLPDREETILVIERRDIPMDLLWAFGAGWHEHLEDLLAYVTGMEGADWSIRGDTRFDELAPSYREMTVVTIED
jgi:uncharacterized protein YndB with AHSA1/START domain